MSEPGGQPHTPGHKFSVEKGDVDFISKCSCGRWEFKDPFEMVCWGAFMDHLIESAFVWMEQTNRRLADIEQKINS